MKNSKFLVLLFIAVGVVFTGCKKDNTEVSGNIVAKWGIKKTVATTYTGSEKGLSVTDTNFKDNDWIEFKADGTVTFSDNGDTDQGTYTYNSDTKKITLKYTGDSSSSVIDVKTLTDTDLVITEEDVYTEGGVTYKTVSETSCKKR